MARPSRPSACRWPPPTRSTSSTPPAPPAGRRASCATTAGTRSRCAGAWRTSTTSHPGEVFWAASDVGWVVGHSYIVYAPLLHRRHDRAVRGQAGRHARRGRVLAGRRRARGERAVHRADRVPGDQEGGPGRRPCSAATTLVAADLFLAGERLDPDTYHWASRPARRPGDRPLVADRDRLADRRQPARPRAACRSSRARRPCPCPATTCACSTPSGADCAARRGGRDRASGCRCRPARCPRSGTTTSATSTSYLSRLPRPLPDRRRRLPRRGRLPVRDGPHRRRDQRGRAPAVHRRDGGGPGRAPGGGRVRGDRRGRRAEGPGPARLRGAQGGRGRSTPTSLRAELVQAGPRPDRRRSPRSAGGRGAGLPKTRSGKILRKTMRGIADGADEPVPSTIEDPAVLDALRPIIGPHRKP